MPSEARSLAVPRLATAMVAAAAIGFIAGFLSGCAEFQSVGAGAVTVFGPVSERESVGVLAEIGQGSGRSSHTDAVPTHSTFVDTRARVVVTPSHQSVAATLGASRLWWTGAGGSVPLRLGASVGPAVERAHEKLFFDPAGQARFGTGFVLRDRTRGARSWLDTLPSMRAPDQVRIEWSRARTLLSLDLVGECDVRLTRAPVGLVALVVGVTWTEETWTTQSPRIF